MKKIVFRLLIIATFALAGCGGASGSEGEKNSNKAANSSEMNSSSVVDSTELAVESTQKPEKVESKNPSLDENGVIIKYPYVLDLDNATYKILSSQKLDGSVTGDPIIILEMEFTNKNDRPQSPYMSFVTDFDAQQTDGTTTTSLNGANGQYGNVEDQAAVKMGDSNVNGGATVKAIIGYTLQSKEQPITFLHRPSQISGENNGFIIK